MRLLLQVLLLAALAFNLATCGLKGKLKSPSQIAREEAKQQKKEAQDNAEPPLLPASPASPASPAPPSSPAGPQ